jgi:hypothetical protein
VEISFFIWVFFRATVKLGILSEKGRRKSENRGDFVPRACSSGAHLRVSTLSPVSSTLLDLAEFLVGTPRLGFYELMAIELAA